MIKEDITLKVKVRAGYTFLHLTEVEDPKTHVIQSIARKEPSEEGTVFSAKLVELKGQLHKVELVEPMIVVCPNCGKEIESTDLNVLQKPCSECRGGGRLGTTTEIQAAIQSREAVIAQMEKEKVALQEELDKIKDKQDKVEEILDADDKDRQDAGETDEKRNEEDKGAIAKAAEKLKGKGKKGKKGK